MHDIDFYQTFYKNLLISINVDLFEEMGDFMILQRFNFNLIFILFLFFSEIPKRKNLRHIYCTFDIIKRKKAKIVTYHLINVQHI